MRRARSFARPAAAVMAAALLSACDGYYYQTGAYFEKSGRFERAARAFDALAERDAEGPRAAEALVRAGEIYQKAWRKCPEARRRYESALRRFPGAEPWAERAKAGLMSCPDYFPLREGWIWTYGDSASGGRNMRLEWSVRRTSGSAAGEVESALFAGDKRISAKTEVFEKKDWTIWQVAGASRAPLLRFPYSPGMAWSYKSPQGEMEYFIESDSAAVKTAAGDFAGCLKVRELNRRFPGTWKYDYYAPGVGRVKTTIAGPGYENPNTELLKFDKIAPR